MAQTKTLRGIKKIIRGVNTSDGAGVKLKRVLGSPELDHLDPFLLLDEFKNDDLQDYQSGFPDHPHRGIETVTYLLAGAFTHRDSRGHEGHLDAGSVQWMTAGRGIIHSEMPEQTDGLSWGFQLWLNLPARLKMTEPRYQDIASGKIPVVESNGVKVKILAGHWQDVEGPSRTWYPVTYFDVQLEPGSNFTFPVPEDHNAFLYVIEGKVSSGGVSSIVSSGHLGVFGKGDAVKIETNTAQPARFLFAAAQKLNEPIVRGGPFVMNTIGEIRQAFLDYQTGRLG